MVRLQRCKPNTLERDALAASLIDCLAGDPLAGTRTDAERRHWERAADLGRSIHAYSLPDICRAALRIEDVAEPSDRTDMVRAALSTTTLVGVFSNTATKQLVAAYDEQPRSTDGWVKRVYRGDFKVGESNRMSAADSLTLHAHTAQHQHPQDVKEEWKIYRFSSQTTVDETAILNDDMSAFDEWPTRMAIAANRLEPDMVATVLLENAALSDGLELFTSGHSNTGTPALNGAAVQAAQAAIRAHRDNGAPLNLRGEFLIVPPDLEYQARQIARSGEVRSTGDTSGIEYGTSNPLVFDTLKVRTEARIDATGVADPWDPGTTNTGSADNWFLACGAPHEQIHVGYLRGTDMRPQLTVDVLKDPGQWGIGMAVKHDIGAKAIDFRGLYRSTGDG